MRPPCHKANQPLQDKQPKVPLPRSFDSLQSPRTAHRSARIQAASLCFSVTSREAILSCRTGAVAALRDRTSPETWMPYSETDAVKAVIQEVKQRGTLAGIWKRQNAAEHRALAGRMKGVDRAALQDRAGCLDAEADELLDPTTYGVAPLTIGTGGEVANDTTENRGYVDTLLESPDMVAADASRHRLGLAAKAGGIALALDAAQTAKTANSLEQMMAHQTAAAHIAAIELQAEALVLLGEFRNTGRRSPTLVAEAARLMTATARMMNTTQQGVLALHRLRTAGRQTLVVQHVHVGQGGQAVVAGKIKGGGRDKRTKRGE